MVIDAIVIAVLFISALIAFFRGFIREVLTILGVVGGLAASYYGGPYLDPYMQNWLGIDEDFKKPQKLFDLIPYEYVADALSYGSIFILVVIILSILSHTVAEKAKKVGLGAVDRSLGVVFGLVRGALLMALLYLPFYLLISEEKKEEWFADSKTHVYLSMTAEKMAEFLPEETLQDLESRSDSEGTNTKASGPIDALNRMDLLNRNGANRDGGADGIESGADPDQSGLKEGQGYTPDLRREMDRLFENQGQNGAEAEE